MSAARFLVTRPLRAVRRGGRSPDAIAAARRWIMVAAGGLLSLLAPRAFGQLPGERVGDVVPRDVREVYERGLQYLVNSQTNEGHWPDGYSGPGTTGMAVMAMLASGEDPNFGLYSGPIRRALRAMIAAQDPDTGYLGNSMYHHGFGMLALAEAYGAVDDRNLWEGADVSSDMRKRTIGQSLELAVRAAITSQKKNPLDAWRYSPDATDADTSVSGAVLVGLLAARNAGIEVPDEAIDKAVAYFKSMTSSSGQVAYSGGFGGFDESLARISIGNLVFALARRKDLNEYKATLNYLTSRLDQAPQGYVGYARYYESQALFQGDVDAWEKWNRSLVRQLKNAQKEDGHIEGEFGPSVDTAFALLALALNYRFLPIYER